MGTAHRRTAATGLEPVAAARTRTGRPILDHPWLALLLTSAVVLVAQIPFPHATAWHFFEDATELLLGESPLRLYVERPDLQFGPLSIVIALPFTALGDGGALAVMIGFSALGLGVVWLLFDTVSSLRTAIDREMVGPAYLAGGILFVAVWGDVSVRTAHIDDAITLIGGAVAMWALARRLRWWVVVAVTVAGAAKPWGLMFAPLAAVLPGRNRWVRVVAVAALASATWAPFVIAQPDTLNVSGFEIINEASSSLRRLGVTAAMTPQWVRPAQLIGGLLIATALVWRGRWTAVMMATVAFRLLIDPAANRYYTVGLVLGLLFFELARNPRRIPWLAVAAAAILEFGQHEWVNPALSGWARLVLTAGIIVLAFRHRPVSLPGEL